MLFFCHWYFWFWMGGECHCKCLIVSADRSFVEITIVDVFTELESRQGWAIMLVVVVFLVLAKRKRLIVVIGGVDRSCAEISHLFLMLLQSSRTGRGGQR